MISAQRHLPHGLWVMVNYLLMWLTCVYFLGCIELKILLWSERYILVATINAKYVLCSFIVITGKQSFYARLMEEWSWVLLKNKCFFF